MIRPDHLQDVKQVRHVVVEGRALRGIERLDLASLCQVPARLFNGQLAFRTVLLAKRFQGRFALDGRDKLNYLTARLGDEIARMRGKSRTFAPHAERPDQIVHKLGSDTSLWVLCGVFALAGLGAYLGYRSALGRETDRALVSYNDLVKLPPRSASVTITLP